MPTQKTSLSISGELALAELARRKKACVKGGRNRWKNSTPKQRSDSMRAVALAKKKRENT
jgi:ribosomal protein L2